MDLCVKLQRLICHNTPQKTTNQPYLPLISYIFMSILSISSVVKEVLHHRVALLVVQPLLVHVKGYITCKFVLLLQQFPTCLVRLIWIVFVMSGWWPYISCFVGCCLQNLFNTARIILE